MDTEQTTKGLFTEAIKACFEMSTDKYQMRHITAKIKDYFFFFFKLTVQLKQDYIEQTMITKLTRKVVIISPTAKENLCFSFFIADKCRVLSQFETTAAKRLDLLVCFGNHDWKQVSDIFKQFQISLLTKCSNPATLSDVRVEEKHTIPRFKYTFGH